MLMFSLSLCPPSSLFLFLSVIRSRSSLSPVYVYLTHYACLLVPASDVKLRFLCLSCTFFFKHFSSTCQSIPNSFSAFYNSYYDIRNQVSNYIVLLTPELLTPFKKIRFRPERTARLIYQILFVKCSQEYLHKKHGVRENLIIS